ncbi:flagellar biosynthetic protein FliO [Paenibacillus alkaliterrae]|uniref:flagellar biosynthetic protein FliO n=1 Tax=Paenibacillus alkaliterrae TaxID=320909 RepID=UPI001F23642B|nr:flagellar biosynthetic protein FliO [Paenibacillus alkaliterrae]MCF2937018.1 flagellar biosynthetic protein FliO [Paenibacillus alkaliterrae]
MFNLHTRISMVSALGMAICPRFAAAAAANGSSANSDEQIVFSGSQNVAGSLIWVIISLAIVIVLIIFVIKWLSQRSRTWGTNRSLRSLGGIALGQNNSLQVVEVAGKIYIVGVGESITLIDKLDDPEEVRSAIEAIERQPESAWPQNFLTQLIGKMKSRNGKTGPEPSNEQWNQGSSFQHMLQSKLSQQADRKQQLESLLHVSKSNERLMDDEK